ncbi:MAG: transcription termination factor Rho [Oscillospiraceae bacterium]|jgi:transcription termination factor Rho|nr:transcription termination factor Rho [Oscillospiraceae bacterium]
MLFVPVHFPRLWSPVQTCPSRGAETHLEQLERPAYDGLTVVELRKIARQKAVKVPAGSRKQDIIRCLADTPPAAPIPRSTGYYNEEYGTSNPAVPQMLAAGVCGDGGGVLELQPDGYGFLRARNCSPSREDVYVSIAQIRRFCMKNGDLVQGKTRPRREGDRYSALMYVETINGQPPDTAIDRRAFDSLTPIHPNRRLTLESPAGQSDPAIRMLDFIAPIGLGQRALIVAPPKAGKTILLKKIALAVAQGAPDVHLMLLLIDERPEEVTDIQRTVPAEVIYSTFDAPAENHIRVSELVYERAQRLVEQGKDVVVLMDSLTRLSRAYNAAAPQSGRALSGGLAPGVLQRPKRFFGAARNLEEGGSLTIIATVLVDTGSRMDEIIFEEFKGTGNAEIQLDRSLSEKRVFPAIDLARSGTRREELLLGLDELQGVQAVRRVLSSCPLAEATEQLIGMLVRTQTNADFFARLREWIALWKKEGYTLAPRPAYGPREDVLRKKGR